MPTLITHSVVALAAGKAFSRRSMPVRFWVWAVVLAVLPDVDVIGFRFGVAYGDFWGHRGFTHSLLFAAGMAALAATLVSRGREPIGAGWRSLALLYFGIAASHGILDAFTDGGRGIALLSPFDVNRYFAPWRPILVSPIGLQSFLTGRGAAVLRSESIWIGVPLLASFAAITLSRRRAHDP